MSNLILSFSRISKNEMREIMHPGNMWDGFDGFTQRKIV